MVKVSFVDLDSQLEAAGVNKNAGKKYEESPYLGVGTHPVKIIDVQVKGSNKLDPTWIDVELTVEGPNNKTRRGYVAAPTTKITYGKYDSKREFFKFKDLARSLGVQQNQLSEKLPEVVEQLINNPASVVGAQLEVEIGYDAVHVKKIEGSWKIVNYKGEVHPLFTDKTFEDRDTALAAAKLKGVWIQQGPTVVRYKAAAAGPGITLGGSKSVKEVVTKKPKSNMPF